MHKNFIQIFANKYAGKKLELSYLAECLKRQIYEFPSGDPGRRIRHDHQQYDTTCFSARKTIPFKFARCSSYLLRLSLILLHNKRNYFKIFLTKNNAKYIYISNFFL